MAASGLSATGRKNLCVQVSYQAQAPNCSRDLLGIAVSKPPEPASCNHSTVLASPRPLQSGSLKHPPREGCVSTVNSSEHGQIVGGHRGAQGIHHKHIQKGGAVSQFSEVGSCQTPSAKPAPQEPCSLKYSKATKAQSVVVRHPHRAGSIALPKQVLAEAPEGVLPNLCCEPSVNKPPVTLHTAKVSASGNLIPPKKGSGNCSKKPIVEDSLPAEVVLEAQIDHLAAGHLDGVGAHVKEGSGNGNVRLNSQISISNYLSPSNSFYSGNQLTDATSVKDSFVTAKVSDGTSSIEKTSGSAKLSDPHPDFVESEKSSICGGSTGSDVSEESSSSSSFSSSVNKPHKANDSRWEAIQAVRSRDGVLGVSHFRLLKRLGCGDIGSVYLAELCGTKSHFAMKIMDKAALGSRKKLPRAQTEREILQSLDHPFLPTLYAHFETDKFSCLVMEFCPGGDLHTLRQRQPGKYFPEQAARFYVAEVLLALEYLHMLGIIYRDLKPENVLVRDDGHIMLSDFDLSLRCAFSPSLVKCSSMDKDPSKKNSAHCVQPSCIEPTCTIQPSCVQPTCFSPGFLSSRSKKERKAKPKNEVCNQVSLLPELIVEPTNARSMSFVGTHEYLAPEIIKGEGHGSAVDWWTFGIFLYELLFGKTPFKGSGNRATLFNVVGQPLRFPESPMVSFAARDLIRGLLVKEPQHRLAYRRGATEVKQHPFFQSMNWALIRCTNPPEVPKPFEIVDFPPRAAEVVDASTSEKMAGVDVKPSGNYLEIDFF